jgi:hypothetical protein
MCPRFLLYEEDRLAGKLEALPATYVAASYHIVDPHHVRAGSLELFAVPLIRATGKLNPFRSHHPTDRIRAFLAAVRADKRNLLGLFFLFVESFLVHSSLPA